MFLLYSGAQIKCLARNLTFLACFPKPRVTLISKWTSLSLIQIERGSFIKCSRYVLFGVRGTFSLFFSQLVKLSKEAVTSPLDLTENLTLPFHSWFPHWNRCKKTEEEGKKEQKCVLLHKKETCCGAHINPA